MQDFILQTLPGSLTYSNSELFDIHNHEELTLMRQSCEIVHVFCTLGELSDRIGRLARYPEQFDQHHQAFDAGPLYAKE